MSLKSFDKFCEKMINGEPVETKDIFDERQSVLRTRITMQAMKLFIVLTCLNIVITECGPQWCESMIAPTVLFYEISYMFWLIKNACKGSLFGIKGTMPLKYQASFMLGYGILFPLYMFDKKQDFFENFFVSNGMVSENVILILFFVLLAAMGIMILIFARRYKKEKTEEQ